MAGRSGSSMMMTVTNTKAKDLAYTNCVYCSPSNLRQFTVPGSDLAFALVGDVFVLSVAYPFNPIIYYYCVIVVAFDDCLFVCVYYYPIHNVQWFLIFSFTLD